MTTTLAATRFAHLTRLRNLIRRTQPVSETFMPPFLNSTRHAFETMLGAEISEHRTYSGSGVAPIHEISAVIGLGGETRGAVIMSFPRTTAERIAARLLGEGATDDATIADAVGEVVNVVAGAAKPALRALGLTDLALSLPTVVAGAGHRVFRSAEGRTALAFLDGPLGHFSLQVCFSEATVEAAATAGVATRAPGASL